MQTQQTESTASRRQDRPDVPKPHLSLREAFREAWRAVRVIEATLGQPHGPGAVTAAQHVRAIVHLGRLTPADVEVHALTEPASGRGRRGAPTTRLFTSQSYCNGSFVFEGDLGHEEPPPRHELVVRVVPSTRWADAGRSRIGPSPQPLEVRHRAPATA